MCLVAQTCPTLCDPTGYSLPGKNTGVGCHAKLQGICPTQGSNPGLPLCRQILYCLSHQGSPKLWEKQAKFQSECLHFNSDRHKITLFLGYAHSSGLRPSCSLKEPPSLSLITLRPLNPHTWTSALGSGHISFYTVYKLISIFFLKQNPSFSELRVILLAVQPVRASSEAQIPLGVCYRCWALPVLCGPMSSILRNISMPKEHLCSLRDSVS